MKLSVITVCFNEKDNIKQTFDSIYNQDYKNIEHIIIDGGSTDGTIDEIKKYEGKYNIFISEPDGGIYNAMNKGLTLATGDVIFFLNAKDNFYSNDVVSRIMKYFPKKDFVFGQVYNIYPDNKIILSDYSMGKLKNYHVKLETMCQQAVFYKKSLFNKFGTFDESYKIAADSDFNTKVILHNILKVAQADVIISNFYRDGISSTQKLVTRQELYRLRQTYLHKRLIYKLRLLKRAMLI